LQASQAFSAANTTFAAFLLDTALLYERGELGLAAALGTILLSIAGLFACLV